MLRTCAILFVAALALSACNTMRGVGQDMSSAGHAISESATEVQNRT